MADALASNTARFRIWIRRRAEPQGPYSIRFEVTEGKGILRVVRPGVLVDPPARPSGFEERLTAAQVNTSRFLHVWDGGRYRHGHSFARLDEAALEALPPDRWIPLDSAAEGTLSMLLLPAVIEPEVARVDDEPTWPRRQMLAELQRELRELETRDAPVAAPTAPIALPTPVAAPVPTPVAPAPPVPTLASLVSGASGDEDLTEVRSVPPGLKQDTPAPEARPEGDARASRAERVEFPRSAPPPRAAPAPQRAAYSLEALLQASIPKGPARGMDDEQTVLMGGTAFAVERVPEPERPVAAVLPRLAPLPPSAEEEHPAIEAGEASDEDGEEFDVVSVESGHAHLEALEALQGEEDDEPVVEDDGPEITDVRGMSVAETLQRGRLTEPVTVVPLHPRDIPTVEDVGDLVEILPTLPEDTGNLAIEAGDDADASDGDASDGAGAPDGGAGSDGVGPDGADGAPVPYAAAPYVAARSFADMADEADPHELAPTPAFHERNTTLVRFLRRRIASDRVRIAALEQRVADLEGELLRRTAR